MPSKYSTYKLYVLCFTYALAIVIIRLIIMKGSESEQSMILNCSPRRVFLINERKFSALCMACYGDKSWEGPECVIRKKEKMGDPLLPTEP